MKSKSLAVIGLIIVMTVTLTACSTAKYIANTTETYEYEYVICDVKGTIIDTSSDITRIQCEMPNGELHEYKIEDAPEGEIELVCFRTINQDDYTSYEVVSVR